MTGCLVYFSPGRVIVIDSIGRPRLTRVIHSNRLSSGFWLPLVPEASRLSVGLVSLKIDVGDSLVFAESEADTDTVFDMFLSIAKS